MSVRVGVVGAGVMGADHVNTLHRFVRNAVQAAVADVAPTARRRLWPTPGHVRSPTP
jgi:myo-inositol 2-dehydrogenase / D-chiro-inositol 1-dehydrogenase